MYLENELIELLENYVSISRQRPKIMLKATHHGRPGSLNHLNAMLITFGVKIYKILH